ncbi:hypothetical protein [Metabacillus fastidiosus]|uniref:hypothetical protein n=1 Tax=Metabacillus fastidiosus TaxID=1458 RepID=UPI002DBFE7F9|nr:hypothetical protein [Metabacillus fastidiosus]MEC2074758.1 hypothetical protein [Metabacillus fastidiosus]
MAKSLLLAFIMSVFILSSCHSNSKLEEEEMKDKQILFFSDDSDIEREAVYYDAILDLRKEFPEEIDSMKVISDKKEYGPFKVDTLPSLIVVEKKEVVVRIEGTVLVKEKILNPISNALMN